MQRDDNGRFIKGHSGGPGRPPRKTERAYLERLTRKLTISKWNRIVDRAIQDAIAGDRYARQWLSDYAVGRPALVIDLNASDQALLNQVLAAADAQGIEASALFNALLQEIAEPDALTVRYVDDWREENPNGQ